MPGSDNIKNAPPVSDGASTGPGAWLGRWAWRLAAALVAVAGVLYFGSPYLLGPVVPVSIVKRQDIVQTVVASGLVQTPFRIDVGSKVTGLVRDIPVIEGQTVKAGDLLIQLDDAGARATVATAQAGVAQAEAKLRQIRDVALPTAKETLAQAEAGLLDARQSYQRANDMAHQGSGTKAALDEAKRALDIAQSQLRAATIQVTTNSPGGMDFIVAGTIVDQAKAELRSAEAALLDERILASRDGTLITRNVERGDTVQPGTVLMVLAPAGETQIVVQIDEQNLGMLRMGQKATASADAYPKQSFGATIAYINPSVNSQSGSVEVKLAVSAPPAYLRQDMTVSTEIETARKTQAIVVETGSIHDIASAHPWVTMISANRAQRHDIVIGLIGDAAVEVLDGLAPGDKVVRAVTTSLVNGQRVRARADE